MQFEKGLSIIEIEKLIPPVNYVQIILLNVFIYF